VISQVFGYWLNQVTKILAIPAEFLEFFSLQNPTPLRGFGEKKGPFINKPWSKNSCNG
jgi:hypothetical protein